MYNRFFGGLRGRLLRSFLLVILISVGVLVLVTEFASFQRINETGDTVNRQIAAQAATLFADHYTRVGSWAEIEALVQSFTAASSATLEWDPLGPFGQSDWRSLLAVDRLVVTDAMGRVVADSSGALPLGAMLPPELAARAAPIFGQGGGVVGQLSLTLNQKDELIEMLRNLLRRIVWGGGLLAISLAVALSIFLTYRVAEPIRQLSMAAQELAVGTAVAPLPVKGRDEIGELTHTFNDLIQVLAVQKRYRQQMVADIAHELRTPLSIMQINVEAMADGLQTTEQASQALQREITALSRLIDDLRLLSTADAGGLQMELEPLAVRPFLEQLVQTWQAYTQQLCLHTELLADAPPLLADRIRLAQVINNLISNALRYAPEGETIEVGGRHEAEEVVLWVSNPGAGIPPEALPHVFERFYRVDGSRSRETGGTGLGLAIVRRLVALHNGRVWVNSIPGEQTTFYVAIPTH